MASDTDCDIPRQIIDFMNEYMTQQSIQIIDFMNEYMTQQSIHIKNEKEGRKNRSKAFKGLVDFGEDVATYVYPNSIGSASKGGCAFDNFTLDETCKIISAREVKTCCQIQPKECNKCKNKVPYYQPLCIICKNDTFTLIKDSRFSISAKPHFDYIGIIEEYLFIYIYDEDGKINIKGFVIKSDNPYFNKYIRNQYENSKSPTCNLLPDSYDFQSSGPKLIFYFNYNQSGDLLSHYIDIHNDKSMDFNTQCLYINEKIKYGIHDEVSIPYEEIQDKLELRDKPFNKDRGKTSRIKK